MFEPLVNFELIGFVLAGELTLGEKEKDGVGLVESPFRSEQG
jgi:hypothetical protein